MRKKRVYLTIDDSPTKDFAEKVDYLFKRNIPAVFFCVGEQLLGYRKDAIEAIKKGFIIGNHGMVHNYFSDMDYEECAGSILETDLLIEELYREAGVKRDLKLFRFPHFDQGGDKSSDAYEKRWLKPKKEWTVYHNEEKRVRIQAYLKSLGYEQPWLKGINLKYFYDKNMLAHFDVRWTFDQMEYLFNEADAPFGLGEASTILARMDGNAPYNGLSLNRLDTSDIILLHDQEKTTELFYEIIEKYIEKGFFFESFEKVPVNENSFVPFEPSVIKQLLIFADKSLNLFSRKLEALLKRIF